LKGKRERLKVQDQKKKKKKVGKKNQKKKKKVSLRRGIRTEKKTI